MTTAVAVPTTQPDRRQRIADPSDQRSLGERTQQVLPWLGLVVGVSLLQYTYYVAARSQPGDRTHFQLFWIAVFVFLIPVAIRLLGNAATHGERLWLVGALGAYSIVPKLLSYRGRLAYFDEIGHWTQTERLVADGFLFVKNSQIIIISDYPGLHTLTASMSYLTGLSVTVLANILIATLHVVAMLGLFSMAKRVSNSDVIGGVAALVYSIGPGFWFFSSQFAYESSGLVLVIWTATLTIEALDDPDPVAIPMHIVSVVLSAALVVTHHLTSFMNLLIFGCIGVAATIIAMLKRGPWRHANRVFVVMLIVFAIAAWWFVTQAPNTRGYIGPYVQDGASDLVGIIKGGSKASTETGAASKPRKLFSGSTLPLYEIYLGLAAPLILMMLGVYSFLKVRKEAFRSTGLLTMVILSTFYFAVFPLIFSQSGAEIARRTWSFTSIGLAVLLAYGLVRMTERKRQWTRAISKAMVIVIMMFIFMGNVATGMNEVYRFPGPYIYGSDTRSATAEIKAAAAWFLRQYGENQAVAGDRNTQVWFGSIGRGRWSLPNAQNRQWDFVLAERPVEDSIVRQAAEEGIRWIIIDRRQAQYLPLIGFYVDQNEPLARQREVPLSPGSITKFDGSVWAIRVFSSTNVDVYRIDEDAIGERVGAAHV